MLPTCIGISGVSRYRNDASIEDSFLASLMVSSRKSRGALAALLAFRRSFGFRTSGLCILRRPICNGKGARSNKLTELPLGLGQPIRHRPQGRGVHAEPHMAGKVHLD